MGNLKRYQNHSYLFTGMSEIGTVIGPGAHSKIPGNIPEGDLKSYLYANECYVAGQNIAFIAAISNRFILNSFDINENNITLTFDKKSPLVTFSILNKMTAYVCMLAWKTPEDWVPPVFGLFSDNGLELRTEKILMVAGSEQLQLEKYLSKKKVTIEHPRM